MRKLIALAAGALFGWGLCLSGMVRPSKVLGVLDVRGAWDATLIAVVLGALVVHAIAWRLLPAIGKPRYGTEFPGPPSTVIDTRLLAGAALFGLGWGLAGFCPGPAVVSLVSGARSSFVFVAAMVGGMLLAKALHRDDG